VLVAVTAALSACVPVAGASGRETFDFATDEAGTETLPVDRGIVHVNIFGGAPRPQHLQRGRRTRRLRQFDALDRLRPPRGERADGMDRLVTFDADGTRVAIAVTVVQEFDEGAETDFFPAVSRLDTARLDGRAVTLASCRKAELPAVAVDRDTVAWVDCDPKQIRVRDLAVTDGGTSVLTDPSGRAFGEVKLAGPYVAAHVQGASQPVVVFDRRTGSKLYETGDAFGFDLQEDGKVAVQRPRGDAACSVEDVAWYSPAEPSAHTLPGPACGEELAIAGDRILWSRRVRDERTGSVASAPQAEFVSHDVVTTDLSGGAVQPIFPRRDGPSAPAPRTLQSFDGERIAYEQSRCSGDRVVVDSVAELESGGPPPLERCTVSLAAVPRRVTLSNRGKFRLRVRCTRGCDARVRLWVPSEQRYLNFPNFYGSDFLRIDDLRPRRTRTLEFQLTRADRQLLARRSLKVQVQADADQPDFSTVRTTAPLELRR
jgi:hypothetical protein